MGYWKHESNFKKARFIRQKTYIEDMGEYIKITCAGLPESCYKNVNFNNFHEGFKCKGKLRPKHVKGGIILEDSEFTLKSDLVKNTKKKVEKK